MLKNPLKFCYNTPMLEKKKQTRIMTFGTFDGLHQGHLNLFKQIKKLAKNPFLVVSIARDVNVKMIKGEYPVLKEKARMVLIKKCLLVDKVVLGGRDNYISHIIKEHPDVIALGYDQTSYVENLKKDLKNKGIFVKVIRLKAYKEKIFKNHLLKKRLAV